MVKNIIIDELDLDGGVLCLDLANTVSDRQHMPGTDYVNNFDNLLYWAVKKAKVISEGTALVLQKRALAEPAKARQFCKEAIELRELIYHMFLQVSKNEAVSSGDLDTFNEIVKKYLPHLILRQKGRDFSEAWNWEADSFYQVLAPVVKTAYELLLSDKLDRIKQCGSDHCGWLFLDTSKNGKRRWCSMKTCGSNDKAIKYYYRQKESKE